MAFGVYVCLGTTNMASDLLQRKQALKDKLLEKCEHGFYRWFDPNVAETRLCDRTRCTPTLTCSTYAFRILRALATTPTYSLLLVEDIRLKEMIKSKCPLLCYVYLELMACISSHQLAHVAIDAGDVAFYTTTSSTVPDYTPSYTHVLLAIVKVLLLRDDVSLTTVRGVPLANAVALLGASLPELQNVIDHGYQLQFPVALPFMWRHIYAGNYRRLCGDVVSFIIQQAGDTYPFDKTIDELVEDIDEFTEDIDKHLCIVYPLAYSGKYPLSKPAFLMLAGYGVSQEDNVNEQEFLSWLQKSLKDYTITPDDVDALTDTWGNDSFFSYDGVKLLVENLEEDVKTAVISALLDAAANSAGDVSLFQFDMIMLYLFANSLLPSKPRSFWESLEFAHDEHLDVRIMNYICQVNMGQPNTLATSLPIFSKAPDLVVQFSDQERAHVYSESVTKRSPVLNVLVEGRGFKQVTTSCGTQKLLVLQTGLPESIANPEQTINVWITFCYTGAIKPRATTEDIIDLKTLADYLQDQDCVDTCNTWLEHQYMSKEEHYANGCGEHTQACGVCTRWKAKK